MRHHRASARDVSRRGRDAEGEEQTPTPPTNPLDAGELRNARLDYYSKPVRERERENSRRHSSPLVPKLNSEAQARSEPSRFQKDKTSGDKRKSKSGTKTHHREAKESKTKESRVDKDPGGYVYVYPEKVPAENVERRHERRREGDSKQRRGSKERHADKRDDSHHRIRSSRGEKSDLSANTKAATSKRQGPESSRRKSHSTSYDLEPEQTQRPRKTDHETSGSLRPGLQRSKTNSEVRVSWVHASRRASVANEKDASEVASTPTPKSKPAKQSASAFGRVSSKRRPEEAKKPVKMVTCEICIEDTRESKAETLACNHIWCHACLRRMFTGAELKAAPQCCEKPLPAECADKVLTNDEYKVWRKKMREIKERDPLYCPKKGCSQWITRNHFFTDHRTGRKYGECTQCKTKACPYCKGLWHRDNECPQDPDKRAVMDLADKEGWKQCHRCGIMVEKSSGCNHMSCPCGAEFCYRCGEGYHPGGVKACECSPHDLGAGDYENVAWLPPAVARWLDDPQIPQNFAPQNLPQNLPNRYVERFGEAALNLIERLHGQFLAQAQARQQEMGAAPAYYNPDPGAGGHFANT